MTAQLTILQTAKRVARNANAIVDRDPAALADVAAPGYRFRSVRPFYELSGADAVVEACLAPIHRSLSGFRRQENIFFAGFNQHAPDEIWTCSHGSFMGSLDRDLLDIPATGRAVALPYAEFHRVEGGQIAETALFLDLIALQQQCGLDPVPTQTGARLLPPAPATGDGVLLEAQDPADGEKTRALLDRMIEDIVSFNARGHTIPTPEWLARTWHEDMAWYGPGGIGTALTIPRYQEQHQRPFREALSDKVFNGHVCRIAEGNYTGWFGWPNLNNRNVGGFLGLPRSDVHAEMRVVDIYRRAGDRIAENWVFIDLLHYAHQLGVDLLKYPDALWESPRARAGL